MKDSYDIVERSCPICGSKMGLYLSWGLIQEKCSNPDCKSWIPQTVTTTSNVAACEPLMTANAKEGNAK